MWDKADKTYRPEIEGLRAVAALLVAVYHIYLARVSGGVDVFFVISGFLLTGSLLRQVENNGRIDFVRFWAGLVKRLFPVAMLVLVCIGIASLLWLPKTLWHQTAEEIFASSLYFQNWQLAFNAVDYLDRDNAPSPVLHFWALSVLGQLYLLLPFVVAGSAWLARAVGRDLRNTLLIVLGILFAFSFGYSVYQTAVNQPWAYFDTFARVWEFSLGGLLTILLPRLGPLPHSISIFVGWLGLSAIMTCGLVLQGSTVFPGYAALWPALGAVFVIAAGRQGPRLLTSRPLTAVGGISYSLYLWHWPLLLFYLILSDRQHATLMGGLLILGASVILAALTTRWVEHPIRTKSDLHPWRALGHGLACLGPVLLLVSLWSVYLENENQKLKAFINDPGYPGAMARVSNFSRRSPPTLILPSPLQAKHDRPSVYEDGCHQSTHGSDLIHCYYHYETKGGASRLIALVGASNAATWVPALRSVALHEGWNVVTYTKDGCRFTADHQRVLTSCRKWNKALMEELLTSRPSLVITLATDGDRPKQKTIARGYIEQWSRLKDAAIPVLAIADNPWFKFDVPTCVDTHNAQLTKCSAPRSKVLKSVSPDNVKSLPENVHFLDLSAFFCDKRVCPAVIGNILVYRDSHHMTATYSRTMAAFLRTGIFESLTKFEAKSSSNQAGLRGGGRIESNSAR